MRSISRSGALLRPLVVEARSLVVLDGSHRLRALRALGASLAPVALVGYETVKLDGWVRVYGPEALRDLRRVAEVSEVRYSSRGPIIAYLGGGDEAYYDLLRLEGMGHGLLRVVTRSHARGLFGEALLVVPPRPSKGLVLRAAESGRLLPPRSTRHITEAKLVRLRTPLSALGVGIKEG